MLSDLPARPNRREDNASSVFPRRGRDFLPRGNGSRHARPGGGRNGRADRAEESGLIAVGHEVAWMTEVGGGDWLGHVGRFNFLCVVCVRWTESRAASFRSGYGSTLALGDGAG